MKIDAEHIRRFDQALLAENPICELFDLATALRDEGVSQLDIYMLFERFQIAASADAPQADWIPDVVDFFWGYSPYNKQNGLFPHTLTNEEIETYRRGF